MIKNCAIGVEIGGSRLRTALVTEEGEIIRKFVRMSDENIFESLVQSIENVCLGTINGIGIGIPGVINKQGERVLVSRNIDSLSGTDIIGDLRRKFAVPVFLNNDANLAALGEKVGGAGKGFQDFVLLSLGLNIGGGIIQRGRLLSVPAEFGHMSIRMEGEKCYCGNIGCLENYASAKAMIAKAIAILEKGTDSILKDCCKGSFYKLTTADIYNSALEGDILSREILRDAGKHLGIGLANIINVFNPEAIILTGGLIGAWNIYISEAIKEASRRAFKELFDSVKILPSSLGDEAGIVGAACHVFNRLSGSPSL